MSSTSEFQYTFEEYNEAATSILRSRSRRSRFVAPWMGWVLFIGLAVLLFLLLQSNAQQRAPFRPVGTAPPCKWSEILVALLPWLLVFSVVWGFIYLRLRVGRRRLFNDMPALHRRRRMEFDDVTVVMLEEFVEERRRWEGFVKFQETKNLFLLYISLLSAHFIPKRAFVDGAQVDQFRALAQRNISAFPNAFPVIPTDTQSSGDAMKSSG